MSLIPEEFTLMAFNGYKNSAEAGEALFRLLNEVGGEIWNSEKLQEPDRRRVFHALRDLPPAYHAFVNVINELPFDEDIKERLHFRLVKMMDDLLVIGGHSIITPKGRKLAQGLQGKQASEARAGAARAKNSIMWPHIEAEAIARGRTLVDSDECARELQPGVCARMNVDPQKNKGFSHSTIRKQIRSILEERTD